MNDDGTCTKDKDESKTPIGVVVYIGADNCGWAISKDSIGQFQWSTEHTDIVSISNHTSAESAIDDFDSCGNTQKIIQAGNKNQYPAAWAAYQYEPGGTSTRGKWCLPAAGIWNSIYKNKDAISDAISKIRGMHFQYDAHIWSSTERDNFYVWSSCKSKYGVDYNHEIAGKTSSLDIRPVLAF